VAIAPVVTGSDYYEGWIYQGGAFQLGFNLFWAQLMADPRGAKRIDELYRQRPLASVSIPDAKYGRIYREWLDHPTDDAYWQALSINRRYGRVRVPVLNVGGWYDIFLRGTLENFVRMQREAGSEHARRGQRLVIGPWSHGSTFGPYPDHSFDIFGPMSAIDLTEVQLGFFSQRDEDESPVRIFVMGENRWRDADAWPPERAEPRQWFLHGGGSLSPLPPGREPPDTFVYDPADPAPTVGGPVSLPGPMTRPNSGPLDQRRVEERPDVLVYTSEPLEQPLEVVGPLGVTLHATTSAQDTDFVAKLCDVWPDGVSRILTEGIRRASFREGYDRRRPVEPGRVYAYTIDLVATANVFQPGHRVRIVITSSSFPRFDPNPNTGGPLGEDDPGDARPARQTIFHDSEHPSHVLLPVVSR
jgi:putative CocE/NonD family hydrolase